MHLKIFLTGSFLLDYISYEPLRVRKLENPGCELGIKTILLICAVGIVSIGATAYFVEAYSTGDGSMNIRRTNAAASSRTSEKIAKFGNINNSSVFKMVAVSDKDAANLIGQDENKNFVRDDIDQYIDKTYPDPRQHAAMVQFAAAYGQLLVNGNTVAGAKQTGGQVVQAIQCGIEVFGNSNVAKQKAVLAMILNSEDRFAAYANAVRNEEGQVFPRFQGEPCL